MIDSTEAAKVLAQALPYIQAFQGQTFVIKYGGSVMGDPNRVTNFVRNLLLLQSVGIKIVVVHGGGPEIDRWLSRVGIEKTKINGLRVTDEETMEVVEMVLSGKSNKGLVAEVEKNGGSAIGLSGRDGNLLLGKQISEELGRVGEVIGVRQDVLDVVTHAGFIPIVATVASDSGGEPLNINADSAAAAIAGAMKASKLILMTDTNGVLADVLVRNSTLTSLTPSEAKDLISTGRADQGMIPKLEAALFAVENGVKRVHFINASTENALILEVFTEKGIGTMISAQE